MLIASSHVWSRSRNNSKAQSHRITFGHVNITYRSRSVTYSSCSVTFGHVVIELLINDWSVVVSCFHQLVLLLDGCLTISTLQSELDFLLKQVMFYSWFNNILLDQVVMIFLSVEMAGDYCFNCSFCQWIKCRGFCHCCCGE